MRNCSFLVILFIIALVIPGCGGGGSSDGAWYGGGGGDSGGTTTTSPTITSCSLSSQQFTPGSVCTVQGTNFGDTRSTKDGGASNVYLYYNSGASYIVVPSANIVSWSSTSITFIIPTTAQAGTQYIISVIRVVNGTTYSSGTTSTSANTVTPSTPTNVPTITNISPSSGITAGTTSITITGTNFGSSQATGSYVGFTLNGVIAVALSVTSWGNNQIVVVVPSGTPTGSVSVYVQTATGGSSASSTIVVSGSSSGPSISSISPASASQGGSITISGTNFGSSSTASYVMIGSVQAAITSWGDNAIVCTVPLSVSPGSRNVTVTTSAGTSSAYVITVVAASGAPYITSISPTTVNQTSSISITGGNFGTQGSNYVMVGSVAGTVTYWSSNLITVTISTSMSQGSNVVYVSVGGISSNTSTITIVSSTAPTISSLSPTSVTQGAGSALTIYGTNFGSAGATSYVTIGGYTATITSWGVNTIVVTVPTSVAAGSATVYVIVAGVSTNAAALTVTSTSTPSISGISGTTAGSTCTISGSGFGSTTGTVTIGGVAATVTGWGTTAVYCTFPYTCAPTGTLTVTASTGTASTTYTRTYGWGTAAACSGGKATVSSPKVLFDKRSTNLGDAMLFFMASDGANIRLWAVRYSAATGFTGATIKEVDNVAVVQNVTSYDCAMDTNGRVVAVYVMNDNNVYSSYYTAATDAWTSVAGNINASVAALPKSPKIAMGSDTNAICVFVDGDTTVAAKQWVGATPGWNALAPVVLQAANANNDYINIAMDSSNNVICTYLNGANPDLRAQRYTTGVWPATWTAQGVVSNGGAVDSILNPPKLAVSSSGNAVATYVEGARVRANRYTAGGAWAAQETVDAGAGGTPQVTYDSSGNAVVIYLNGGFVYGRQLISSGGSSALMQLDDNSGNACTSPFIAVDPTGAYGMLGYVQSSRIVTRKYTASSAWASAWAAQAFADGNTTNALSQLFIAGGTSGVFFPAWIDNVNANVYYNIYR